MEEKEVTPNEGEVIVEDVDGDGYTDSEDCNDEDASIYPDATEICDGLDNNREAYKSMKTNRMNILQTVTRMVLEIQI